MSLIGQLRMAETKIDFGTQQVLLAGQQNICRCIGKPPAYSSSNDCNMSDSTTNINNNNINNNNNNNNNNNTGPTAPINCDDLINNNNPEYPNSQTATPTFHFDQNTMDLGAPPPYAPPYATAPPYYPTTITMSPEQRRLVNTHNNSDDEKEDLDFFKYTIPCKRIAGYISVCVAVVVIVVILLLLIFGKM